MYVGELKRVRVTKKFIYMPLPSNVEANHSLSLDLISLMSMTTATAEKRSQ